jgi:glycosyltransferase involved in cell wall biosynthesis
MQVNDVDVRIGKYVKSDPRVSIMMPSFNVAPYISAAIESILSQSFTDYEIIVVNDGSPDTEAFEKSLEPYFDHVVYVTQEHGGVAAARNTGLRLARAPIIAQLDPDDEWLPNFLSTLIQVMDRRPDLDVVYSNAVIFGGTGYDGKQKMELSGSSGEVTFDRLISEKCTVLSSLIGKKEIFVRVGGFDESLRASEDFDMWLRILKCGGRIDYDRSVLARSRRRKDSLSANDVMMCGSILRVLSKAERTLSPTLEERQIIAESRLKWEAFLNLSEGKRALVDEDADLAIDRLTKANRYYKKQKISLLIRLLQIAPRAAINMLRGRFEDS